MTKVAILGKTGMLGSTLVKDFEKTDYELVTTTRAELNAESSNIDDIAKILENCNYAINCIGIIKPYIHDDNSFEVQRAINVNALFPHKLAQAANKTGTKIIQIATDCVFDGVTGNYNEEEKHNPTDVYGKTKSLGEVYCDNFLNLRCSIIGKEEKSYLSLLEWFLNQPKNAQIRGFKNHYWNGVTTNAFADICIGIIKNNSWFSGLQHIVAADSPSKAEMLHVFAKVFDRNDIKIEDIDAQIPINRTLSTLSPETNKKIWIDAGYKTIPTVEKMISDVAN